MKSQTLIALAVAGTCAWSASALAGGMHGAQMKPGMSVEVQTPSSVDESAPWLSGESHLGGWSSSQSSSMALAPAREPVGDSTSGIGASVSRSGSGSVSSDPLATNETTEYWLIGSKSEEANVGSSALEGAGGSVSFDSPIGTSDDPRS